MEINTTCVSLADYTIVYQTAQVPPREDNELEELKQIINQPIDTLA